MFLLGLLALIGALLVLIGVPYALIAISNLKQRVQELELQLGRPARPEMPYPEEETEEPPPAETPPEAPPAQAETTGAEPIVKRPPPVTPPPIPPEIPAPPPRYILREENFQRLGEWLRANWTLAIAALSLIFGGLFMVQYGIERGLLTPPMRVLGALILGAAMIGGGEWLRRRFGDVSTPSMQHLPSTFAGAGVVVVFIGLLSANALYGLIGPGAAIAAVAVVALGAVVMGWLYGAVLPAIGLLGATAAPFLVSASDADPTPFYAYFAIIGLAGLAIDSFRRWAWVSALALVLACFGLTLVHLDVSSAPGLIGAGFALALGALILPERRIVPVLDGAGLFGGPERGAPSFPALLGAAGIAIATVAATVVALKQSGTPTEFGLAIGALVVIALAIIFWLYRSPALDLTIALPGVAFLGVLAAQPLVPTRSYLAFRAYLEAPPETPLPMILWLLMGAAGLIAASATWRLNHVAQDDDAPARTLPWALAASAILPATALVIEFLWSPRAIVGNYPWALAAMIAAALLVLLVTRRAARGGPTRNRDVGLLAAAAFLLIALAFFLLLTKAALTLGLALLMALATGLDRRFDLRVLSWVAQLGAAVIGCRLLIDPGLDDAIYRAGWTEFGLTHLGALAGFEATRRLARKDRPMLAAVAESALLSTAALTVTLTLAKLFDLDEDNFWLPGLSAAAWAASAMAQVWRLQASTRAVRVVRGIFAAVSTLVTPGLIVAEIGVTGAMAFEHTGILVNGPPVFDGLALAFGPLAITLGIGAWALGLPGRPYARYTRLGLSIGAAGFAALWGFYEIRRLWRGPDLSAPGPSDGELYSYTVAMLIVSLALLAVAVARRSEELRRIAMAGVALTIVKVFLLDMSGLSGLTRVASFIGLGLALAGLAWVNRKIDALWHRPPPIPEPIPEPGPEPTPDETPPE